MSSTRPEQDDAPQRAADERAQPAPRVPANRPTQTGPGHEAPQARDAVRAGEAPRGMGDALTVGFGIAVAMWVASYVTHWPGVTVPPAAIFAVLILIILAGGLLAGRLGRGRLRGGLGAGCVAGALNLLPLGAVLRSIDTISLLSAALWAAGMFAATAALCAAGALLAPRASAERRRAIHWPSRFAWVACATTLSLLSLGGIVTGFEAGLAVPDWPNSFGYNMFLYPLSKMTGGIFFEHSHRLLGTLVGLATLTLALYVQIAERRIGVKVLAWAALLAVILQGVMGGLRVQWATQGWSDAATRLAIVHGVFAQVFLSVLVLLAIMLAGAWKQADSMPRTAVGTFDRGVGLLGLAALLTQLVLGALLRHQAWGLLSHVGFAMIVLVLVGLLALRAWGLTENRVLERWGLIVLATLGAQVALGITALVAITVESVDQPMTFQVLLTTAHQTVGAVLLASTAALVLWRFRLDRQRTPAAARPARPAADGERAVAATP